MKNKESYFDQLDRTIGFVRDCDHKTSIVLAAIGIIATIIIDQCGKDMINLVSSILDGNKNLTPSVYFFTILLTISLIFLIFGIWKFIRVLIPVTDSSLCDNESSLERNSIIFAVSISKLNYEDYKSKILNYTDEEYINDILSQIYINSKICARKYKNYKNGLIYSIVGVTLLIISGVVCEIII